MRVDPQIYRKALQAYLRKKSPSIGRLSKIGPPRITSGARVGMKNSARAMPPTTVGFSHGMIHPRRATSAKTMAAVAWLSPSRRPSKSSLKSKWPTPGVPRESRGARRDFVRHYYNGRGRGVTVD
jgi:hypothetical protein